MLKLTSFNRHFLDLTWNWLQDEELRRLIDSPIIKRDEQLIWFQNLQYRTDYLIKGVVANDEEIGVVGLKNIIDKSGELFIYIAEEKHRGKGYGQLILNELFNICITYGLYKISLKVLKSNSNAINFYLKNNFSTIDEHNKHFYMEKSLI